MNLNYEKIRAKVEHGGNQWTSYSDLFLVLSVVFLLLYVVANLRNGTMSLATSSQLQQAKAENEELKKQIKTYELLREDYLKQGASGDEVKVYQELMDKLSLLEGEAKDQHKALYAQAKEAEEKEKSLNHYQALVKNIISANLVASSRIKKRDLTIVEKDKDIGDLSHEIEEKQNEIKSREQEINANNQKIAHINTELENQIQEVKYAYRSKKKSKEKLEQEISSLENQSRARIKSLKSKNYEFEAQLQSAQSEIEKKNRQTEQLLVNLAEKEGQYKKTIAALNDAHDDALRREKAAFEQGREKAQLSADAKIKQEQDYRAAVERKNQEYNAKLSALNQELAGTSANIKNIEAKYQQSIGALKNTNDSLERNLKASIEKQNEQKRLAQSIKSGFAKHGIDADIDLKTGDVTINFKDEYFDSGSSALKTGMKSTLEKLIPEYAKSLFIDPKIASRISSVEIVGFASPTYQGKYVNPGSLSPDDRNAVNYNMDLSYQRAKSIFEHVFDTNKMTFAHQKTLLPLVKVGGRSYLATDKNQDRGVSSSTSISDYCKLYDCKKSQKVIIKFNLRDE